MALKVRQLSAEEIRWFRSLVEGENVPRRLLQRAYIIWLSAQGCRVPAIASQVGVSEHTVRFWITRFTALGKQGIEDLPRPGAKRKYTDVVVQEIFSVAKQAPATVGLAGGCWTLDRLAAYLQTERGIAISRSRVNQILVEAGVSWRAETPESPVRSWE